MIRIISYFSALTLSLLSTSAYSEKIANSDYSHNAWQGAAYSYDDSGNFLHCAISTGYENSYELLLSVSHDLSFTVAFAHPDPIFQGHDSFHAALYIDNFQPIFTKARVLNDDDMVILDLPNEDLAKNYIRIGRLMRFSSFLGDTYFRLDGTNKALGITQACAEHYIRSYVPPVSVNQTDNNNANVPIDDRILYEISASMISELQINNFQYVNPTEFEGFFPNKSVIFNDEIAGVIGFVSAVNRDEAYQSLKATDGLDMGFMNFFCDGETAFTSRDISVNEYQARELRMVCIDNKLPSDMMMTKTSFGDFILYTGVQFLKNNVSSRRNLEIESKNLALTAAKFVMR